MHHFKYLALITPSFCASFYSKYRCLHFSHDICFVSPSCYILWSDIPTRLIKRTFLPPWRGETVNNNRPPVIQYDTQHIFRLYRVPRTRKLTNNGFITIDCSPPFATYIWKICVAGRTFQSDNHHHRYYHHSHAIWTETRREALHPCGTRYRYRNHYRCYTATGRCSYCTVGIV